MRLTVLILVGSLCLFACAPTILHIEPAQGPPGTVVSLSMQYLVGWPRVEIAGETLDYYRLKLLAQNPARRDVSDMELVWIEDKILQFRVPNLAPGEYRITVHDDKGPPGDPVYSALESTAYLVFPPVWPFVMRSNETAVNFRVTAE